MISINEELGQKNSKTELKRRARIKGPLANWENMERLKTVEEM